MAGIRRVGRHRKEVVEYLVKWAGYGPEWNQWVKAEDVMESTITWTKRDGQHHDFVGGVANTLDCQTHIILQAAGSLCANILITITDGHHR